jgi:diacylglycerol O-acyltransferase / wax synthase
MSPPQLSALDAGFLVAEKPGFPLHIGGLAVLEGPPLRRNGQFRFDDVVRLISAHLDAVPRFRQKPLPAPFGAGLPRWVDSPQFDPRRHVRVEQVPAPGDQAALEAWHAAVQAEPLPNDRPLWEFVFGEGLEGDRIALAYRVHHALVDGVSGAEALAVLLSAEPQPDPPPADADWVPAPPPAPVADLVGTAVGAASLPFKVARALARAGGPRSVGREGEATAEALRRLRPAPRCSLNGPVGPRRSYRIVAQSLDVVKAAGREHGAKVNDVVLAAVAGGVRRLLEARGELADVPEIQVMVPVSIRPTSGRLALGNLVTSLWARLPVGVADPGARLAAVRAEMDQRKGSGEGEGLHVVLSATDLLPTALRNPLTRWTVHRQPFVNLVVTNVPGVQFPLYLLGSRMVEAYPFVPLSGNLSIGVAILSYDGQLNVGITADPDLAPDIDVLVDGIRASFTELGA